MHQINTAWFNQRMRRVEMSQRRLARLLRCDAASVNRLLHGQRPMRLDEVETIAAHLGVDAADVLENVGVKLRRTCGTRAGRDAQVGGAFSAGHKRTM